MHNEPEFRTLDDHYSHYASITENNATAAAILTLARVIADCDFGNFAAAIENGLDASRFSGHTSELADASKAISKFHIENEKARMKGEAGNMMRTTSSDAIKG